MCMEQEGVIEGTKDRNLVFVLIGTPGIDLFRSPIHGVMMMMMIIIHHHRPRICQSA